MEEERTHREIELRSEEVQEVMGRIPPAILRYGIVVLLGIIAVVLAGSACFSYPTRWRRSSHSPRRTRPPTSWRRAREG